MKYGKKLVVLLNLLVLWSISSSYAQSDRILQALEDDNPKRALKIAMDSEEDPEFKKDPEIYFLKAAVIYELMKDEFWLKKNPDAVQIGIKAIKKGKGKAEGKILAGFDEVVANYVVLNNMLGNNEFKINKYGKAYRTYMTSHELNEDKISFYHAGKCALYNIDTALGEKHYLKVIHWSNEDFLSDKKPDPEMVNAYLYFIDKYWSRQKYDSANFYLDFGRKIFGASDRLDFYQKEVAKQQIAELPPSSLMMEIIQKNLDYFPQDTFFIRKENALYVYQIRTQIANKNQAITDSLINQFTASKVFRASGKFASYYKKHDPFIGKEISHVYWALANYYNQNEHIEASNYLAERYVQTTLEENTPEAELDRWAVIIDYAAKSKSLSFSEQLLNHARRLFPEKGGWDALEKSLLLNNFKKDLDAQNQGARYRMILSQGRIDGRELSEEETALCEKYIDELIRVKRYTNAETAIDEMSSLQPDYPIWERKREYLAKEDFYYSYFMTRIREETVAGMTIEGYTWSGSTVDCSEGSIDDKKLFKIQDRINYFRRNAGVPEIYLDPELNSWCQKAALMMEANRVLNHNPNRKWSCYSDEGAEAAKYSLLTKGVHTSTAISAFAADNSNPSVGHRRWVLYPNGKAFGFGSTENYAALWALDDSGNVDSSLYMERFVAWPPEGYIPKMMAFRFWSFSLFGDLQGAKVKMSKDGENIPLKIQDYVDGYGMPTVSWEPEISFDSMSENQTIHVVVELLNGRRYEYDVIVMDFDAVGY